MVKSQSNQGRSSCLNSRSMVNQLLSYVTVTMVTTYLPLPHPPLPRQTVLKIETETERQR